MGKEDLKGIAFFKELSDDILDIFVPLMSEEQVAPGEMIFEEGSISDKFFIITEGEVEIRKVMDREKESSKLIAVLSRGEFFGEMAVFLGQPRSAHAIAKTDASLLTIRTDDLAQLFEKSPEAAFKTLEFVMSILMDRLRNTTKELAAIYETGRLITSARSIEDLSEYTISGLQGAVENAEAILFSMWNEFNDEFEVSGQLGFDLDKGALVPVEGVIKWLSENRESFLSFDLNADKRLPSLSEDSPLQGRSMVASPLLSKDKLQGFLVLLNRTNPNAFSYNHMVLLSAIGGYVTVALENMRFIQAEIDRSRLSQGKSSIGF